MNLKHSPGKQSKKKLKHSKENISGNIQKLLENNKKN